MELILPAIILGSCIGSFLNVVIDRLSSGKSIVTPQSHCDKCKRFLTPLELIPVLSYIYLKGRCKTCHTKLSIQYPLSEIVTGLIFGYLMWFVINTGLSFVYWIYLCIIFSCLIVVIGTDLKKRIILDEIVFFGTVVSFLYILFFDPASLLSHIFSAFVFLGFFLFLFLITKGKGMGFGDVKFSFFMGLTLGYPQIIVGFYLAFLTGALVSLILVIGRVKSFKSTVPFGAYLALAMGISLLFGDVLWQTALRVLNL